MFWMTLAMFPLGVVTLLGLEGDPSRPRASTSALAYLEIHPGTRPPRTGAGAAGGRPRPGTTSPCWVVPPSRTCASRREPTNAARNLEDVDLRQLFLAGSSLVYAAFFALAVGLQTDQHFNAANSDTRMRFLDEDGSHLGVFLDELGRTPHDSMGTRPRRRRDAARCRSCSSPKTQVVQLEQKDRGDLRSPALSIDGASCGRNTTGWQRLVRKRPGPIGVRTQGTLGSSGNSATNRTVGTRATQLLEFWEVRAGGAAARLRGAAFRLR